MGILAYDDYLSVRGNLSFVNQTPGLYTAFMDNSVTISEKDSQNRQMLKLLRKFFLVGYKVI